MTITVRYATSDEDVLPIFELLLRFAAEFGRAPVDPQATVAGVYDIVKNGAALVAEKNGQIVGSIGIFQLTWWYSPQHAFLTDRWLYIVPEHRGGTAVYRALLKEAREVAKSTGLELIIAPNHSPKTAPRTEIGRVGEALRFDPIGSILMVN